MAKKNNDYFELIKKQTTCCVEASNLLEEILCKFQASNISEYRDRMHEIEHRADGVHHDILNKLSTEFITPIDQEDILRLVQIIDDITDALDEVILDMYMYHIKIIPDRTAELSKIVNRCVKALDEAAAELKNFKKREALHSLLVKVNDIETEADYVYIEAVYKLFEENVDGKTLTGAKAVYEALESCCDLCENAADIIEQVVIKNT
ncbi:MAG: DUF47 family protein [Lachnospiraceae bacterium]|nr:DUF47 family protein [Lachnospiraceae bacterium]